MEPVSPSSGHNMGTDFHRKILFAHLPVAFLGFLIFLWSPTISRALIQPPHGYLYQVRSIEVPDPGISTSSGLSYLPAANVLLVLDGQGNGLKSGSNSTINMIALFEEELAGTLAIPSAIPAPLNGAFDVRTNSLYFLDQAAQELARVQLGPAGHLGASTQVINRFDIRALGLQRPQGMVFDPRRGDLIILDAGGSSIIRLTADPIHQFDGAAAAGEGRVRRLRLNSMRNIGLRGIAYNPANGHIYVLALENRIIYELAETGQVMSARDLSGLDLRDPQGMVFAPSGDPLDDPAILNLYLADSGGGSGGGQIVELSLTEPALMALPASPPVSLVQTIDTSAWSPPSPDPMGIDFNPRIGSLLISDSEVEEMTIFQGVNVYESTTAGSLVATCNTMAFSKEPTGVAVNPANGHIFFSDDDKDRVFEVNPGLDGQYCTPDDTLTSFSTRAFYSYDPEGVAYGQERIFIADGVGTVVFAVSPGANGVFDGVPPTGDDQVSNFDTTAMGLRDPEGIGYHRERGTLFIVSRNDKRLVETTIDGTVVNVYNIAFLKAISPSGVGIGPGSKNPGEMNVYITDRGVDNNADPTENDGKVYEIALREDDPSISPPAEPGARLFFPIVLLTK